MLHLTCSSDSRYVPHSAAMLHSALAHGGADGIHVHYVHGRDCSQRDRELLAGMVEENGGQISFLEVDEARAAGLPSWQYISATMWYRIFLPELLPDIDRILYLDVDVIVLDSLMPLWEVDLSEHYVGAVTNVFQANHMGRPAAVGFDDPRCYFNSGVLLMNLQLMRRDGISEELSAYARERAAQLEWPDQDALNAVLGRRRRPLHPRWNCMNSVLRFPWSAYAFGLEAVEDARRNPAIRHFEGPSVNKPWHYLCDGPLREAYLEHRRQTPWPELRLEGTTPANVARRRWRELRHVGGRALRRRPAAVRP